MADVVASFLVEFGVAVTGGRQPAGSGGDVEIVLVVEVFDDVERWDIEHIGLALVVL